MADQPNDGKIVCQIDGARVHAIQTHLRDNHPDWTIERYREEYPDAPLLSERAKQLLAQAEQEKRQKESRVSVAPGTKSAHLHEVFGFGNAPAALSSTGQPISVTVLSEVDEASKPYVAEIDPNYIFNIEDVKDVMVAFEIGMNFYAWGKHGTGKTTLLEQCAARTGRPFCRVQHTIGTEEAHVLGQYVVRTKIEREEIKQPDGSVKMVDRPFTVTEFQLGPLPLAMLHGMVYCADEYDIAMPGVIALYQPVLEGKPLVIKEAPPEFRVIKPHPNFRFVATGNTNGCGDETGLYQGTIIQNAAMYSRFHLTKEIAYMDPQVEESVLLSQTPIDRKNAAKIVEFANNVREQFADSKLSMTISPREMINAATLGVIYGADYQRGIKLAFANRLPSVDKQVVEQFVQRIFGH